MTTVLAGRRRLVVGVGSLGVLVAITFVFLRPTPPREPDAVLTFPSLGQVYAITLDTTRARGLVAGERGVTLFNTDTNTVISTTPMRMYASDALAMAGQAGVAVVAVPGVSTCAVTFLRTRDGAVLRHLQAPNGCIQATVDEALRQVYLLCLGPRTPTGALAGPGRLVAYDLRTGRRRFDVTVGMEPVAAAIDSRTHHVVVANFASSTVTVVDGRRGRVVRTVAVGKEPAAVGVDEQTGRAFVVDDASRSLSAVSMGGGAILPPHLLPAGAYEHLVVAHTQRQVVFLTADGLLIGFDPATGARRYRTYVGDGSGLVVDDQRGYAVIAGSATAWTRTLRAVGQGQLSWAHADAVDAVNVVSLRDGHIVATYRGSPTTGAGVAVDERRGRVFVVDQTANAVDVLGTAAL